ncbi:mechanosensitive ion channel family protein [Ilyomonas limi]|uniref:Mechanosensitive ion channel family protein n=1 Tax=Ilyomonas limi TaxID=2575867 RepID=A0A4U3L2Q1_9BACT|nr:mechanosensitive ion channel domain-containing protein [Ilyomonas limi]TKK68514.1 mechanosensitive ion channel family protein [Ilyomonas limi]
MLEDIIDYLQQLPPVLWNLVLVAAAILSGLLLRFILSLLLKQKTKAEDYSLYRSIIRRLGPPFNVFLPLFILNMLSPFMVMQRKQMLTLNKTLEILLTIAVAAILIGIVKIAEDYVYYHYNLKKADNLRERKVRTQLQFIRRLVVGTIIFITLCIILLSFDKLKALGTGLLTGVGVGGIIVGFAAQKSLSNLLAGFQIAFTQPLRLDDVLVVEGEYGRVEEITLTYVVLLLWDQRRLILPINYFIEKPFQNWTRTGSEIMGTAMLYLDYNVPVEEIRKEFLRLVQNSEWWDKRVAALQVTNLTDTAVELRCLISANNASQSFDLRCFLRENLLNYIKTHYPQSLPQTRVIVASENNNVPA